MLDYFHLGLMYLKNSIILAVIIYMAYSISSFIIIKKKDKEKLKDFSSISKMKILYEFTLTVYVCAILKVTGIIGRELSIDFSVEALSGLFAVPFAGSSIMMIMLNTMLFIPYGVLVCLVFPDCKLDWKKSLMIGFGSSLCIELFQAFTGRLCEIDDLIANTCGFIIGFLLVQALKKMKSKELRRNGIKQMIFTIMVAIAVIFLLSLIADGDALQKQEEEYFTEIGNREEEVSAVTEFRIYQNGKVFDALEDSSADWETWYRWMGNDIGSAASRYQIQNISGNVEEIAEAGNDKTYMEVFYNKPQEFQFYNKPEWEMKGIVHIVFCIEDGSLWYGSDKNSLEKYAGYVDEEYPFPVNESLKSEINTWLVH